MSENEKIDELKIVLKQRAINAIKIIGFVPCEEILGTVLCSSCIYYSKTSDDWGSHCRPVQAKNLLRETIRLSEKIA